MKEALKIAERKVLNQDKTPFIQWLKDPKLSAKERLSSWYYCCAFFAFGFKDINNLIFKYPEQEALEDPLKMMINRHAQEDGSHWKMYLRDLNTLDLDLNIPLSKTLSMLFGEETKVQRFAICHATFYLVHPCDKQIGPLRVNFFSSFVIISFADFGCKFLTI